MEKALGSNSSQLMIKEAIRRSALGRSIERVDMSPGGTGGVGTARMIHGYVAKIHDDPSDAEFEEYGGTIDVGEYPDETASASHIIHKGVLLAGTKDNSGGFLIIPTLLSDVTIVSDAATRYMYVVNFSHADVIQLQSHTEVTVGVTDTMELVCWNDFYAPRRKEIVGLKDKIVVLTAVIKYSDYTGSNALNTMKSSILSIE